MLLLLLLVGVKEGRCLGGIRACLLRVMLLGLGVGLEMQMGLWGLV